MLSIGEFSRICKVSAKTLRHYAKVGLLLPEEVNPENGYRYYSIDQLETMLLINRLKNYRFSLEEIKELLAVEEGQKDVFCTSLIRKKKEIEKQQMEMELLLQHLEEDIQCVKDGKSIMSYMESIDVQLVDVDKMNLLSIRRLVQEEDIREHYVRCFKQLVQRITDQNLTITAPPMVLFHNDSFSPYGLDIEFAIPVQEYVKGTREFHPGLCLMTDLKGSYEQLPSVYARQREWAEQEGYEGHQALYEVYVNDPSQVKELCELRTEIYYPVRKKLLQDTYR